MATHQMKAVIQEYQRLRTLVPLGTLRTKKDYTRAVAMLDEIIDKISEDEKHPIGELADTLSVIVEKYEAERMAIPQANLAAVLKHFMNEHGLRQTDLPEIGSQGVVSEVLAGKRALNTRQISELAKRFGVSPVVFL